MATLVGYGIKTQEKIRTVVRMLSQELVKLGNVVIGKHMTPHGLVHHTLNLGHVEMAHGSDCVSLLGHGIETEQVESQAVRYDIVASHHHALLLRIAIVQVGRIIGTQVFVKADAQKRVADHDALVKRAHLGVDVGHLHVRQHVAQTAESFGEVTLQAIGVGILLGHVGNDGLKGAVLKEEEQAVVDVGVVNRPQLEHVLYQRARLQRIVGAHLMEGGIVCHGQIDALHLIETVKDHPLRLALLVGGAHLPLTTRQSQ